MQNIPKRKVPLPVALLALAVILAALLVCLVTQPVFSRAPALNLPAVSPDRLKAHVVMLAETLHPRSYLNQDNLEKTVGYIEGILRETTERVSRQYYTVRGESYCNVIAEYGPKDGPSLVIGAHYDADAGEESGSATVTPGADDNASGVAGLLELAGIFGKNPPPIHTELVAYCLEEPPFFGTREMGSYFHAEALHKSGSKLVGMIVLEMIGCFSDEPDSQKYPMPGLGLLYPTVGNYIGVVGRFADIPLTRKVKTAMRGASDLPVRSANLPEQVTGVDYSDHRNYWPFDYSAVMVTDIAFFRNKSYHTTSDVAESLDYPRMAKVVQGVYAASLALFAGE
ncbi:M28 family peptidase [Desulfovibrio sp. OttesenSCG-928-G15]|nr:M28 family peptidase [Desulfovibrio sp. OttesenSCG-928-G15]